jgi:hypothetical protein
MKNPLTPVKLGAFNVIKTLCDHMIGANHHIGHRMVVGTITSVFIAKIGSDIYLISIAIDATGYMLHAIGAIPFIEAILTLRENA